MSQPPLAAAPLSTDNLTGKLLVAGPALSDTEFARSVIYLCAHSPDEGAMGFIVNRRQTGPGQDELFEQLGIAPAPARRRIGICQGGPLEPNRGFVLHSADWSGEESIEVDTDTKLTASVDILRNIAEGAGPRHALLALGHAAWGPGQLEQEITLDSAWFVAPASEALVFGGDHAGKWRRALAAIRLDPVSMPDTVGHA